jgi:hypothetical protein
MVYGNHVYSSFDASDVLNSTLSAKMWCFIHRRFWFSQANQIFSRLQITTDLQNYRMFEPIFGLTVAVTSLIVVVDNIFFRVQIPAATESAPHGFLFLCPTKDLQSGPASFQWSDCAAYWSRDPSGVEYLSTEEATRLGFPALQFALEIRGETWDASVYAGLRQFHQGKGFDPDSLDVAHHLGHQLCHISAKMDPLFAHGEQTRPLKDSLFHV